MYGDNDDAAADTVTVATVNHRRTGSVIDLWSYKRGSSKLRHRKTISSPLIRTPNAVELVSHDSFYSTNDFHTPRAGFLRVFETLSKQAWSDVVYYDGTADRVDVAATGLTFPNGIVYLPKDKVEDFDDQTDLGEVWVASSTGAQVLVFRRKANNKLKLHQHIPLPFM